MADLLAAGGNDWSSTSIAAAWSSVLLMARAAVSDSWRFRLAVLPPKPSSRRLKSMVQAMAVCVAVLVNRTRKWMLGFCQASIVLVHLRVRLVC